MRALPVLLLACLGALPALAEESPATDCTKMGAAVEQVICGDFALSDLEARMASIYTSVRGYLDAEGRASLIQDQAAWESSSRDACAEAKPAEGFSAEDAVWICLYLALEDRSLVLGQTLEGIADGVEAQDAWSGRYIYDDGTSAGTLMLLRMDDGMMYYFSTATGDEPSICDLYGNQIAPSPLQLTWEDSGATACRITFTRDGDGIVVTSQGCESLCAAGGSFDARYVVE